MHPDRLAEQVEVVAHHATFGGTRKRTARHLRLAGSKVVARSANREAVGFFEHALAILAELPETPETLSEALDTHIALGPALIALKGAAAPEVVTLYDHAQVLVDRLADADRRFPVLWERWFIAYTSGDYVAAREIGEGLLEAVRSDEDSGRRLQAHHTLWATYSAIGAPSAAIPHCERGLELYVRERHASQMFT
jgi:hypothetical protein